MTSVSDSVFYVFSLFNIYRHRKCTQTTQKRQIRFRCNCGPTCICETHKHRLKYLQTLRMMMQPTTSETTSILNTSTGVINMRQTSHKSRNRDQIKTEQYIIIYNNRNRTKLVWVRSQVEVRSQYTKFDWTFNIIKQLQAQEPIILKQKCTQHYNIQNTLFTIHTISLWIQILFEKKSRQIKW